MELAYHKNKNYQGNLTNGAIVTLA